MQPALKDEKNHIFFPVNLHPADNNSLLSISRPSISRFKGFKICQSTILTYVKFDNLWILRLKNFKMFGQVLVTLVGKSVLYPKMSSFLSAWDWNPADKIEREKRRKKKSQKEGSKIKEGGERGKETAAGISPLSMILNAKKKGNAKTGFKDKLVSWSTLLPM